MKVALALIVFIAFTVPSFAAMTKDAAIESCRTTATQRGFTKNGPGEAMAYRAFVISCVKNMVGGRKKKR